jgi:hypothetical protein
MRIYNYKNYDHYKQSQTRANKEKLSWVYARETTIERICNDKKFADNIICHGTRNGAEQKFFKKFFPNAYVIGTEISDTASNFPMTIEHDFMQQKEEWIKKFDIVYSNAFDHSIDPEKTLLVWRDQLSNSGRMYLEYAEAQSICDENDPLDASQREIKEMIGKYFVIVDEIKDSVKHGGVVFICEANYD